MSNVIELRNGSVQRVIFYEITDEDKIAIWGGENPTQALKWYRNSPPNSRIWVSEWLSDEEDAKQVSSPIEITSIVLSTISDCMERWAK